MKRVAFAALLLASVACHDDRKAPTSPSAAVPTAQAAASSASLVPAPAPTASAPRVTIPEPIAKWIEPGGKPVVHTPGACSRVIVAAAKGSVTIATDPTNVTTLAEGDAWGVSQTDKPFTVGGKGLAALIEVQSECKCDAPRPVASTAPAVGRVTTTSETHRTPRANAPKFTWGSGTMSAELTTHDTTFQTCEPTGVKLSDGKPHNYNGAAYVGRLSGTAAVGEHVHEQSWEVLFAIEADGTMTLEGTPKHVAARDIVKVPPGAKHAWQPAAGSKLVAVQSYTPPGPENRFKTLPAK